MAAAATAAGSAPRLARGAGPVKYRVAVIGHTGRGDYGHGLDRVWLEQDRQPVANIYEARTAVEMIVAVFESQRTSESVYGRSRSKGAALSTQPAGR